MQVKISLLIKFETYTSFEVDLTYMHNAAALVIILRRTFLLQASLVYFVMRTLMTANQSRATMARVEMESPPSNVTVILDTQGSSVMSRSKSA